jgi:hypothetical protein
MATCRDNMPRAGETVNSFFVEEEEPQGMGAGNGDFRSLGNKAPLKRECRHYGHIYGMRKYQFVALAHWRERGARWLCLGKMIECAKVRPICNPNVGA